CKNARVCMSLHLGDDLVVISNLSVRHKANNAHVVRSVGWFQSGAYRRHHLGSTAGLGVVKSFLGGGKIFLRGGNCFLKNDPSVTCKGDKIKCVRWVEVVERQVHRLFGLCYWKALHRAARVQYENDLLRHCVRRQDFIRRLQDERKISAISV